MTRFILLALAALIVTGCGRARRVDYSVSTLVKTLKDEDPNMRYWAAQSLGNYGPAAREAVPALVEGLKDESGMVRMGAAYALAELAPDDPEVGAALKMALKDPDKQVRDAVTYALKRTRSRR